MVSKIAGCQHSRDNTYQGDLLKIVDELGAWGSFIDIIRQSLVVNKTQENATRNQEQFSWTELPGLCCQAAGGDPETALGVKTAWGMLYTAAHMMDAVVDGDTPDAWWVDLGPPTAINIATALYAGSGLMLLELLNSGVSYDVVIDILYKFQYSILQMCAGQHLELTNTHLSLDEYWRIAGAKSGSFFALACYVGARLATDDPNLLTCFWDYGTYLGSLIQISDDAKDVWTSKSGECRSLSNPLCLLPIIYTFQVASDSEITHLRNALKDSARRPGEMESIRASLEKMGAGLYLITKAEEYRLKALRSLKRMNLHVSHYNKLEGIINQLGFKEPIK